MESLRLCGHALLGEVLLVEVGGRVAPQGILVLDEADVGVVGACPPSLAPSRPVGGTSGRYHLLPVGSMAHNAGNVYSIQLS